MDRPEGSTDYACLLDTLLWELREGQLSRTPIPYIPDIHVELVEDNWQDIPNEWIPRYELIYSSLPHFEGGGFQESRRLDFLINLGRKIKNQRHSCLSGKWAEIPHCYYGHIRSALETMRVPLRHRERVSTQEYLIGRFWQH
uniref:Uncharacterized protein n=1 Tax=Schizaphis graminum TaxID=13262 RepID=A0A2S2NU74_SCHGA